MTNFEMLSASQKELRERLAIIKNFLYMGQKFDPRTDRPFSMEADEIRRELSRRVGCSS